MAHLRAVTRVGQAATGAARVTVFADRVVRKARSFVGRLANVLDLAESLEVDLVSFRAALAASAPGGSPASLRALKDIERGRRAQSQLRLAALTGIASVQLTRRPNGSAVVRIDGGRPFVLAKREADVLEVLTASPEWESDGFPAWLSRKELTAHLEKERGYAPTRHGLTQAIYTLRMALVDRAGLSPHLVQTRRGTGVRLLLRRAG